MSLNERRSTPLNYRSDNNRDSVGHIENAYHSVQDPISPFIICSAY